MMSEEKYYQLICEKFEELKLQNPEWPDDFCYTEAQAIVGNLECEEEDLYDEDDEEKEVM